MPPSNEPPFDSDPLWLAFLAGFEQSAEGFNAEYWGRGDWEGFVDEVLREHFKQWRGQ